MDALDEALATPDLSTETHWGLRLPDGTVAWDEWSGVGFAEPMDRISMVVKLQKTAEQCGFSQEDFLAHYGWVTRTVVYENTGVYALTSPEVSASTPLREPDDNGEDDSSPESDRGGVHPRPLGGDAQ